jgi:fructokinase
MAKRKVIGIGETILDILFKNNQPTASVPGGSTFNSMISLGRMGVPVDFISEVGNDHVGELITSFMEENGVSARYVNVFPEGKSPVSLAFLNEQNDAEYVFYKDYPSQRLEIDFPEVNADDVVLFGSYYALNPVLRAKVLEFLTYAKEHGAMLYYDINFRSTHQNDAIKLGPTIIENFELADIVRASADDCRYLYNKEEVDEIYRSKIAFYCPRFVYTRGGKGISLRTPDYQQEYAVEPMEVVSTVGAGDSFNAGMLFGLLKYRIRKADLEELSAEDWDSLIRCGKAFAANACSHIGNAVSREFAEEFKG